MSDDEIIAVVQAHKEGKKIEFRFVPLGNWFEAPLPEWDFYHREYRVAPEPRKFLKGYCFPRDIRDYPIIGMIKVKQVAFDEDENPIRSEPRKPREWWIIPNPNYYVDVAARNLDESKFHDYSNKGELIHVREVL